MVSVYKNFKKYAKYGIVPAIERNDESKVPQNSFYKSVHYVDGVVGPVKDAVFGVEGHRLSGYIGNRRDCVHPFLVRAVILPVNIVLQPLYLALAYLSYWPAKGLSKMTDKFDLEDKTESLVSYASTFSKNASWHSYKVAMFVNAVLSYVCTAIIWAAALVITPLVWVVDKVASKFSKVEEPEAHESPNHTFDSDEGFGLFD